MKKILDMLRLDEGEKLKAYKCTAGKTTIGVGRNLDDVGISRKESDMLLRNDVKRVQYELQSNPDISHIYNMLDENRQMAIENMCFNLGLPRLLKFKKMWTALEHLDYSRAAMEALDSRWAKQVKSRADRIAFVLETGSLEQYLWNGGK